MCCKCKACYALGMNFRLNFEIPAIPKCTQCIHLHTFLHHHEDTQALQIVPKFVMASVFL